MDIRNVILF